MSIRRLFDWRLVSLFAVLAALLCAASIGAQTAKSGTIKGILLDTECSSNAEARMVSTPTPHFEGGTVWAYTHTRKCLLMPACQRSGYGVYSLDTYKYIPFDAAGNQKALAALQSSKKEDDIRVEVTGQMDGGKLKVASLKILP
jgi:hypothetical protein